MADARTFTLDGQPLDLADFLAVNAESDDVDPAAIDALAVGETITYGGGAAATFILKRES